MPLFAYLLVLSVMLVLSFLDFIQHTLEGRNRSSLSGGPVSDRSDLSTDPALQDSWVPVSLLVLHATSFNSHAAKRENFPPISDIFH